MQCCIAERLKPVVGDDSQAMCKFCRTTTNAHLSSLTGHTGGKKHIANVKAMAPTATLTGTLKSKQPDPRRVSELKVAVFITGD